MTPYHVKCSNKGCDSVFRANMESKELFIEALDAEGWRDNECPECVASIGTEDGIIQVPLGPDRHFTASFPGDITQGEWRTIRDMIGVLSGCDVDLRHMGNYQQPENQLCMVPVDASRYGD